LLSIRTKTLASGAVLAKKTDVSSVVNERRLVERHDWQQPRPKPGFRSNQNPKYVKSPAFEPGSCASCETFVG